MAKYYKFEVFMHDRWMIDIDDRAFKTKKTCEEFARFVAGYNCSRKFRIIEYTTKVVTTKKTAPRGYEIGW